MIHFLILSGESLIGQKDKKRELQAGIDIISQWQGYYTKKFLEEATCNGTPCNNIQNFENTPIVIWKGLELKAGQRKKWETENNRRVLKTYKSVKDSLQLYLQTLRDLFDNYMPDDEIMKVASALNQRAWPRDLRNLKTDGHKDIMEGFRLWAK